MRRTQSVLCSLVAILLLAGVLAGTPAHALGDPIEGTWRDAGGTEVTVTARGAGGFVGTLTKGVAGPNGRCDKVGERMWEIRSAGGTYTGSVFGHSYLTPDCAAVTFQATWQLAAGGSSLSECNAGICVHYTRRSAPATTADTSPPTLQALTKGLTRPGTRDTLLFTVKDDSGLAKVHMDLYEGGTQVQSATRSDKASGQQSAWKNVLFANDLEGPMFFCVWAEDAAGNKSVRAPHSSCAWIKLVVPIDRVSNGCGGGIAKWDVGVLTQNYLGNEHTYTDFQSNKKYTVNFEDACNVHDAGYGGHTVADKLRGGTIDFRDWSRLEVDRRFLRDLRLLCTQAIPKNAPGALAKCVGGISHKTLSLATQVGADTLYGFVSTFGDQFFDSDLTKPGHQSDSDKVGRRDKFEFR